MESEINQLVDMGATRAQARAALKQHKDVMEAAEKIFDGKFDHVVDEDMEEPSTSSASRTSKAPGRIATPDDDDEDDEADAIDEDGDEDGDDDDYFDYDSDVAETGGKTGSGADPYAGVFFSKDRKEEVIEVEEEPEIAVFPETQERIPLMTQGQWMKGCPEGGEQSFLFSLYSELGDSVCPCPHQCGSSSKRRKVDFFGIHPDFDTYITNLRKIVRHRCGKCREEYCIACGEAINADKVRRPGTAEDEPMFHCSKLQGVILGVGLMMLEDLFFAENVSGGEDRQKGLRVNKRRRTGQTTKSPTPGSNDDDDDEYYVFGGSPGGKKQKGGIGYAGNIHEDLSGQAEAAALQRERDEKMGNHLQAVRVYLPSLKRVGGAQTSDYLVDPTSLAHIRRRFNTLASSLLRNDSLSDMSDRSILYFELFSWLETISDHEALASMMAMPIMVVSSVKTSPNKPGDKRKPQIRERKIVYEGSSGPRELLEAIAIQARAALKGLEGVKVPEVVPENMTEEQKRMTNDPASDPGVGAGAGKGKAKEVVVSIVAEENAKLLRFCHRILTTVNAIDRSLRDTKGDAFVERLYASLPKIPGSTSSVLAAESGGIGAVAAAVTTVKAGASEDEVRKVYEEWATRTRFEYCDLSVPVRVNGVVDNETPPHYKFHFSNEARMLANSDIPKRSLAIAKELAVLTTNLPVAWDSSIFLRVDETRVDVIKCLITGPEGTPYYNGCYLFDVFLGPTYNQSPPSVKYMTTNGGKYRFNPNLYADGKVCLSLLGTWQGPGWIAGKSTLLQVLISIQSMILCDEPYLNEPGWATSGGTPQSFAYSKNVRRMVVNTAMLNNLRNPPEPFESIIRTHFRLKARSISAQLDQWLSEDDGVPTTSDGGGYSRTGDGASGSSTFARDVEELKALMQGLQEDANTEDAMDTR